MLRCRAANLASSGLECLSTGQAGVGLAFVDGAPDAVAHDVRKPAGLVMDGAL
ncbi:MAG TPA: hypothetical protein VGL46_18060 [Pseudonocardiaceae bacterium]|jgi:hypothetical protein